MSDGITGADVLGKSTTAEGWVDSLIMRCATCRYWQGDKATAMRLFKDNESSMNLFKGWPNSGDCGIDYEWLETEVHGDATVSHEVPANFGCVYYSA